MHIDFDTCGEGPPDLAPDGIQKPPRSHAPLQWRSPEVNSLKEESCFSEANLYYRLSVLQTAR